MKPLNPDVKHHTKATLLDAIHARTPGLSKDAVKQVLNAFIDITKDAVQGGGSVLLSGFVKFEAKARAARIGRNLKTNETVPIPARLRPVATVSFEMDDAA